MKRSLLLLLILVVILPLFGKVTISESVPEDYRNTIENALTDSTKGRRDVDVLFDSFSLEDDIVSFSINVEDERYETTVPVSYMEKEIRNMLFYSQPLFSESEMKLDYVSSLSYSTISSPTLKRGDVVFAEEEKGNKRGVFVASAKHGDAFELDALYLSSPFPGMKIEKGKGVETSLSYSISPSTLDMSLEGGVSFYTPIYPLLPHIALGFDIEYGVFVPLLVMGGRTMFNFSSLLGSVPFLKNMALDGKVEVIFRIKNKMEISGRWSMCGVIRPNTWLSLSLGYTYDAYLGTMVSLSLGALI
ncbi:MAG: hypothetical protein PUD65_09690 [Spirochaetales bacterium]|nr:hypothetical protein [Spirochaetales bacterium]